jgi:predicted PurR-regulated permease PerM
MRLVVPIAYAVVAFVPFPVVVFFILREFRHLCDLFAGFTAEQRKAAAHPLQRGATTARKLPGDLQQRSWDPLLVSLFFGIIALFVALVALGAQTHTSAVSAASRCEETNVWNYYDGVLQPRLIEMVLSATHVLYLRGNVTTNATSLAAEMARVYQLADLADSATRALLDGSDEARA